MTTPPGHTPFLPPIGPRSPHLAPRPLAGPDVLVHPRTPERGVPDRTELQADIQDFALYEPVQPELVTRNQQGFEHRTPNPDFDEDQYEEYIEVSSHIAGAVERYVTDSPRKFQEVVEDIARDNENLERTDPSDPLHGSLERAIEVQARGLLPATVDAYPYDERFQVSTEQLQRQIDAAINRVRVAAMTHELRGEEALHAALPVLQEAAKNGMAPYIAQALRGGQTRGHDAVHASGSENGTYDRAILNAQYRQVLAEREADAARAEGGTAFTAPSGLGRKLALALSGETGRKAVEHRHAELDEDARKDHNKTQKRIIDDKAFSAVQAARTTAIAVGKRAAHLREQSVLGKGASAVDALSEALLIVEDEHGVPMSPHIVTEFTSDPPMGMSIVTWLRSARPANVAPATGPLDRMETIRDSIDYSAEREQRLLLRLNSEPNGYERLRSLLEFTEDLNDRAAAIDERLHALEQTGQPSLEYQELFEHRRATAMIANQAAFLYARSYSETTTLEEGERNFNGRYGSVALIDGGYLMGDGDNARIYWSNGDIGQPPVQGEENIAFPAVSSNVHGNVRSYGAFVRLTPSGQPVVPGSDRFPWISDQRAFRHIAPIMSARVRASVRQHIERYRADNPVLDDMAHISRDRNHEQAAVNPRDPLARSRAWAKYEDALYEATLHDFMDPTAAESFKTEINEEIGFSMAAIRTLNSNPDLREFLQRDRLLQRLDARLTAEAAKKKPDNDLVNDLRKEQAELNARTAAYGADPANHTLIGNAMDAANALGQERYQALRASVYDGTVRLNQSGEVVFYSGNRTDSSAFLSQMTHLPEGEWHFWPDGRSRLVVVEGKKRSVYDYAPADFPAFA